MKFINILLLVLLLGSSLIAETINYDKGEIEIVIPDEWEYELYGTQLTFGPSEKGLAFSFNVISEEGFILDEETFLFLAGTAVDELEKNTGSTIYTDYEIIEEEVEETIVYGTFCEYEIEDEGWGSLIASFQRSEDKVIFLIILGKIESLQKYNEEIEEILESVEFI